MQLTSMKDTNIQAIEGNDRVKHPKVINLPLFSSTSPTFIVIRYDSRD